jgi:hypothetical protein
MKRMSWPALLLFLALASSAAPAADEGPLRKVDLMRVVGRPVLEADTTAEGLYVYLHQGRLHIAAKARKEDLARGKKSSYQLRLTADSPPTAVELGAFQRQKQRVGKESWLLVIHVGKSAQKMSFKVDGEFVVSDARVGTGGRTNAAPILLGPLGRRGASSVTFGRY